MITLKKKNHLQLSVLFKSVDTYYKLLDTFAHTLKEEKYIIYKCILKRLANKIFKKQDPSNLKKKYNLKLNLDEAILLSKALQHFQDDITDVLSKSIAASLNLELNPKTV